MGNMKQPKSPSPPLVQLYSPNHPSSTVQSSFDMPLTASPGLVQIHHAAPIHGTIGQGDLPRSPFQQMGNKITGHPDTMLPGYQFQQVQQSYMSELQEFYIILFVIFKN